MITALITFIMQTVDEHQFFFYLPKLLGSFLVLQVIVF